MELSQRYSSAINASNLQDDAQHQATEVLAAAAFADPLGALLYRVKYGGSNASYHALLNDWRDMVKTKAIARQWPSDVSASKVARLSLEHWLTDVCMACCGTGRKAVAHDPSILSDDYCPSCNGSAKRPIEAKHNLRKYVGDMVDALEQMMIKAGADTMRKLAPQLTL